MLEAKAYDSHNVHTHHCLKATAQNYFLLIISNPSLYRDKGEVPV